MQCLAQAHTAEVVEFGTLPGSLESWQAGGSGQISGRPLPFLCPHQPISTMENPRHWVTPSK